MRLFVRRRSFGIQARLTMLAVATALPLVAMFRQDCTCPALLFVLHALVLSCTGLSPAMARLSRLFH